MVDSSRNITLDNSTKLSTKLIKYYPYKNSVERFNIKKKETERKSKKKYQFYIRRMRLHAQIKRFFLNNYLKLSKYSISESLQINETKCLTLRDNNKILSVVTHQMLKKSHFLFNFKYILGNKISR